MTTDRIEGAGTSPGRIPRKGWAPRPALEVPFLDDSRDRAMEVLVIAQRTAEEHIRSIRLEAERIQAQAMSSANEIVREAEAYGDDVRREAEQILADANTTAERINRAALEKATEAENRAVAMLSQARDRVEQIDADAKTGAREIRRQAKAELDRLQADRESLLRQIESLENFDREYRLRLLGFMQGQMRALWADNPEVMGDLADLPPEG